MEISDISSPFFEGIEILDLNETPSHARCYPHGASSYVERNNCCERSCGNISGGFAQSWRRWFLSRKRCPTWSAMRSCASSQVGMPISVRSQCITRPARCCPLKRASLPISFWRLFGGFAWPNASREVSDRTRPIVLASEPSRQRTHTGRKDLMLGNMASVRPFPVHLAGTSLPEARDSND
jgi:hypothetical protein